MPLATGRFDVQTTPHAQADVQGGVVTRPPRLGPRPGDLPAVTGAARLDDLNHRFEADRP